MTDGPPPASGAGSLRRRLLAGAALWVTVALLISGILIAWLLTRAVEAQVYAELQGELDRLAAAVRVTPDARVTVDPLPPGPAFALPYSGRYWEVAGPEGVVLRSRSLWDRLLDLPDDVLLNGALHRHQGLGPDGRAVIIIERTVVPVGRDDALRVAVAVNREVVTSVTRPAIFTLGISLVILALGLVVAAGLQVSAGLRPLAGLRRAVADIAVGQRSALGGGWPDEVAPLASELDRVLESNRRMVETARRQAADLAHALKTRLAVAANAAAVLKGVEPADADRLTEELAASRRLLDRHLARVRAGGAAPGLRRRVPAAEVIGRVLDVVLRLSGRPLTVERDLSPTAVFLGDRSDLEEIAGNLIDNAGKWAAQRVRVKLAAAGRELLLMVEDDGPGIPGAARMRVLDPGVRLDERAPGSGLGLTIVGELIDAYGGSVELGDSSLGGLAVTVKLPGG